MSNKLREFMGLVYGLIIVTIGVFAYAWAMAKEISSKFQNSDSDRERLKGFREGFKEGVKYHKWRMKDEGMI